MALEHTVYDARGLRQMNDNDILIKREEAAKAWHLLQKAGFRINTPKSPLHLKIMKDISYHLPALYKDGYALEIHSKLFDYETTLKMDFPDLFTNAVAINVTNKKALILQPEIQLKYIINHFERHALTGECQFRSYADILMLDKQCLVNFQEMFILNPVQRNRSKFLKAAYKYKVHSMHPKHRIFYLIGDIFPSIKWIRQRYKCNGLVTLIHYPHRLGKLLWLICWRRKKSLESDNSRH
jgi:hypothetical protein